MKEILIYIESKYSENGIIVRAFNTLEDVDWAQVSGISVTPVVNSTINKMDPTDGKILNTECKKYVNRRTQYHKNMSMHITYCGVNAQPLYT